MPKKTSRAARVQQSSRLQEVKREGSARPIVSTGAATNNGRTAVAPQPFRMSISANDLTDRPETETLPAAPASVATARPEAPLNPTSRPLSATPGTALPPRRFLNAQPRQNPAITREEEYRYIRADLVTVLVLAILMIVALIVLTFVLGR